LRILLLRAVRLIGRGELLLFAGLLFLHHRHCADLLQDLKQVNAVFVVAIDDLLTADVADLLRQDLLGEQVD